MLGNIGFTELILIAVVALVIFGPQKLPEIGRMLGKTLREFKQVTNGILQDVQQPPAEPKKAPAPVEAPEAAEPVDRAAELVAEPVAAAPAPVIVAPDPVTPVTVEAPKAAAVAFVTKKSVVRVQGEANRGASESEAAPEAAAPQAGETAPSKRLPD